MLRNNLVVAAIVALSFASSRLFSAEPTTSTTTGTIIGTILDAQGNPVTDCIVVAQQAAEKMRDPLQTATDEKGEFKIEDAPEGQYNLKIRTRDAKGRATKTVDVIAGNAANAGKLKLK